MTNDELEKMAENLLSRLVEEHGEDTFIGPGYACGDDLLIGVSFLLCICTVRDRQREEDARVCDDRSEAQPSQDARLACLTCAAAIRAGDSDA